MAARIHAPAPIAPAPNYAAALVAFATALYGPRWQAGVEHLTGANRRTLLRLAIAAREGRDYASAPKILADLHARLAPIAAELAPWAAHASKKG